MCVIDVSEKKKKTKNAWSNDDQSVVVTCIYLKREGRVKGGVVKVKFFKHYPPPPPLAKK